MLMRAHYPVAEEPTVNLREHDGEQQLMMHKMHDKAIGSFTPFKILGPIASFRLLTARFEN